MYTIILIFHDHACIDHALVIESKTRPSQKMLERLLKMKSHRDLLFLRSKLGREIRQRCPIDQEMRWNKNDQVKWYPGTWSELSVRVFDGKKYRVYKGE